MPLTNSKRAGAIEKFGGGEIFIQEVNSDGTQLTTPDSWHRIGLLESTKIDIENSGEQIVEDETGAKVAFLSGQTNIVISPTALQRDADTVNLIKNTQDKFYKVYYYAGVTNAKHQEYVVPVAKVGGKISLEFSTNVTKVPLTIQGLPVVASTTTFGIYPVASVDGFTAKIATASNATIKGGTYTSSTTFALNQPYELFETAE